MPHYLIAGYLPLDFDPSKVTDAQVEEIHALNREMVKAGVRRFSGGLGAAHTLRPQPNGDVLVTDGPFLETKEQVGGLTIVEVADLDEALAWARRGAKAGGGTVEVREILFMPAPETD
ncbi:MAG TPA: YciI family protein [Planctomycetota bacterium]|nr:YciI family protein [Planctomycetota bacterium]